MIVRIIYYLFGLVLILEPLPLNHSNRKQSLLKCNTLQNFDLRINMMYQN